MQREHLFSHTPRQERKKKACAHCHLSLSVKTSYKSIADFTNTYSRTYGFLSDPKHLTQRNHFKTHTYCTQKCARDCTLCSAVAGHCSSKNSALNVSEYRWQSVQECHLLSLSLLIIWCKTTLNLEFILK